MMKDATNISLRDFPWVCADDSQRWFPGTQTDLVVHVLGLTGEAGEVADIIKKSIRGSLDPIQIDPNNITRAMIIEELTDVLIYIGNIAALLKIDLEASLETKRQINEERFNPEPKSLLEIVNYDNGANDDE